MFDVQSLGRILLFLGIIVAVAGGILMLAGRVPFIGQLPGDFRVQREGWSCYFPLATGILISIILTVLLNILIRLFNR
jgi:hypothetical protein